MRSEAEIRQKIEKEHARLVETRKKWGESLEKPLPHHHNIDEEPSYLSSLMAHHESVIYALEWMLGEEE